MKDKLVILKSLADETRLNIVEFLLSGKNVFMKFFLMLKERNQQHLYN